MAHQSHIKNEKYRQWVKAGLGLHYLKEGLTTFCDDVSKQQHDDILDNIKRINNVPSVICGTCTLKTLQPDHVKSGNKQCPYGHANCNCCYTSGKIACPNNICGSIYDSIITYHASTPPAPNWKNTHSQQWITDPWSIAKCFINAPGYEQKPSAADTDCTGLLHVVINNKYFHNHVSCNMTAPNIFSKVRQYRNEIFHSSNMELDSPKTNSYIDDMIVVLQDCKELIHRQDAQEAVTKLQDLKKEDFVITTNDVEKVLRDIKEEIGFIKIAMEATQEEMGFFKRTMEATKEDCEDLKLKVATLETSISELKEKKNDYDALKTDLREKLIKEYRQNLLPMPAMPCEPEDVCDFNDVYVSPRMTIKSKDKDENDTETEVNKMSDIFVKDDKPLKSIYIFGEAGAGKSSFCKSLVNYWCIAHSYTQDLDDQQAEQNAEDLVDAIQVMKNFNFLFFLPLRNCTDKVSIKEMLEEEYEHSVLKELLEHESETCIIVLDGLDEWTHEKKCLPKRERFSNYTVITTSRPWNIGSLGISNNEMQQSIHINGFGRISKKTFITKTVHILNKTFKKDKDPKECEHALKNKSFIRLTHTAMMLQQLICLWFDDIIHKTSKTNLYTCMLDLFFVWYKNKAPDAPLCKNMVNRSHGIELPECFDNADECKSHIYIVHCVSRLAYETLIKNKKETSLIFDESMFQQCGLSDDIKDVCLKLGILSEEKGPSLSASKRRKSHISFSHKSIQEYLAALHIVLNKNFVQESSLNTEGAEQSHNLSKMLNVSSLDELLEQENVLIMLCGLESKVAKSVSKFISDIVARDERIVKYRTTIEQTFKQSHEGLIKKAQKLILNCIDETKASNSTYQFSFNLVDLIINGNKDIIDLNKSFGVQNFALENALSNSANPIMLYKETIDSTIFDCLKLESINISISISNEKLNQYICDSIEANVSSLKCLLLKRMGSSFVFSRSLFCHIANMTNLVALELFHFFVTHANFILLCTFLSGTGNLQQLSIGIYCECNQQHEVDLSKHKHLQYLVYDNSVIVINAGCANLEVISCPPLKKNNYIHTLDFLSNSLKLKEIYLACDIPTRRRNLPNINATVTNRLITLLQSLKQLCKLELSDFTFTESIIKCPSEMKSLEKIVLSSGKMSLTTWQKLVDSVAALPQRVTVNALHMCITQGRVECYHYIQHRRVGGGGGGEEAVALHYVKEHEALFDVLSESDSSFTFSTKK